MTVEQQSLTNSADWPLLLHNYETMNIKTLHYTPLHCGNSPLNRPMSEHLKYGIMNIDKSSNPSSHEVVTWAKNILEVNKTGHCGTLDPKVSGVLTILLNRSTRLSKAQQAEGKEYICVLECKNDIVESDLFKALKKQIGSVLQRPPLHCAVKRNLRLRNIYDIELLSVLGKEALIKVACEAGTYIRTLCVHLGLLMGNEAVMKELRRSRSGCVDESKIHTLHDVIDAFYLYKTNNNEIPLRRVILPLETLLVNHKRLIVKDSAINAICYGGQLTVKGILRYDDDINRDDVIVVVSTKGEAVCLANALITSSEIASMDHGYACKTKRVIMEKDLYPRAWGLGCGEEVIMPKVSEEVAEKVETA